MHKNNAAHRDIKPANFILSYDDMCFKLADLGLS
jgi:serine/threonine protein kinase